MDAIEQSEIKAFFDDLEAIHRRALGFRHRIDAGAQVELGALIVERTHGDTTPVGACEEIEGYGVWLGRIENSPSVMMLLQG